MISIIAAVSQNNCIGCQGKIPWDIPQDKKIFKKLTIGNVVIMGRKTFEEMGRPLPDRINIVVSSSMKKTQGIYVSDSLENAVELAKSFSHKEIFLCGGERIYREGMAFADRLYISHIKGIYNGDAFFPPVDNSFHLSESRKINGEFTFCVYDK